MTSQPDIDPILSDSDACDLSWFFLYLPNSRDKRTIIHCADIILYFDLVENKYCFE